MNLSSASLALSVAGTRNQILNALLTANGSGSDFMSILTNQLQSQGASTDALSALTGTKATAATGRNMALFDPESAYRMMTDINNRDVYYKAQYAELNQMSSGLIDMESAGTDLGDMTTAAGNDSIKSDLQQFVTQYNSWIQRFGSDVQAGGLLADTQAAQVAQYELEQSVKNMFNGAKDGMHGLRDLGITIDPNTKLASLDSAKLDSVLASNKQGVVDTVQEFSTNFAKSADLLNSTGNFMPRQLDNLKRGIQYIANNQSSLQAEFGTGDAARPTGQIAQALAAYNRSYA